MRKWAVPSSARVLRPRAVRVTSQTKHAFLMLIHHVRAQTALLLRVSLHGVMSTLFAACAQAFIGPLGSLSGAS